MDRLLFDDYFFIIASYFFVQRTYERAKLASMLDQVGKYSKLVILVDFFSAIGVHM